MVVFEASIWDRLDAAANAVLALVLCDPPAFVAMVEGILEQQPPRCVVMTCRLAVQARTRIHTDTHAQTNAASREHRHTWADFSYSQIPSHTQTPQRQGAAGARVQGAHLRHPPAPHTGAAAAAAAGTCRDGGSADAAGVPVSFVYVMGKRQELLLSSLWLVFIQVHACQLCDCTHVTEWGRNMCVACGHIS